MNNIQYNQGLPVQLELPLNQAPVQANKLISHASAKIFEFKVSSMQKLINSNPGINSVIERAERMNW